jgi:hypothetical protein
MLSNPEDLSKVIKMIFNDGKYNGRQIISPETLKQMLTPQNLNSIMDGNFRIGLGFWLSGMNINNTSYAWHGGYLFPFHSILIVLPEYKIGVVVLTNSDYGETDILEVAYKALKLIIKTKTGTKLEKQSYKKDKYFNEDELSKYVGQYGLDYRFIIKRSGSKLIFDSPYETTDLKPISDNLFWIKSSVFFVNSSNLYEDNYAILKFIDNDFLSMTRSNGEFIGVAERITKNVIPEAWLKRCGKYKAISITGSPLEIKLPEEFHFSVKFELLHDKSLGQLFLKPENDIRSVLKPLSDTEIRTYGKGRNHGEVIHVEKVLGEDYLVVNGIEYAPVKK